MDQQMETEEQPLVNLGSLNISSLIKASQSQNGLKHSDFSRYRRYCSHKVKRIRKTLKFSYGKKFNKNADIIKERPNEAKLLWVLLYSAEKNWAYAMALKSSMTSEIKKKTNRVKFQLRNRFRRAIKYAQKLQTICETRTEKRSALEAEAYAQYLIGMYQFEVEQWEQAQEALIKSRRIYQEIQKISDSFQSVLYTDKIEQIDQSIRYCSHKANKGKGIMSIESILEMRSQIKDPSLISKLEELLNEHRTQELSNKQGVLEVTYHGESLPVKNPRVIENLQKIGESNFQIQQINEKINSFYGTNQHEEELLQQLEQNFENYIMLFSLYDDATKHITKDKEDPKNSDSEKLLYSKVINYLNLERSLAVLDRNDNHIKQAVIRFMKEDGLNNLGNLSTKRSLKLKLTTPQEIVKHCDNYLQCLKQLMDVERMNPDLTLFRRLDVLESYAKAVRCFFVACLYFSNGKYRESVSLLYYDGELFKTMIRKFQEVKSTFGKIDLEVQSSFYPSLNAKLELQSKVNALKEMHSTEKAIDKNLGQLTLEQKGEQNETRSLFQQLKDDVTSVTLENVLSHRFADLSSLLQLIPPKPIQLDLAYSHLQYPSLEAKKKGGIWGKLNIFKK